MKCSCLEAGSGGCTCGTAICIGHVHPGTLCEGVCLGQSGSCIWGYRDSYDLWLVQLQLYSICFNFFYCPICVNMFEVGCGKELVGSLCSAGGTEHRKVWIFI